MRGVLHIYPAYGPGFTTPRVYLVTTFAGQSVGDVLADYGVPVSVSRDAVFESIAEPRFRDAYDDIVVHQDILHPSL